MKDLPTAFILSITIPNDWSVSSSLYRLQGHILGDCTHKHTAVLIAVLKHYQSRTEQKHFVYSDHTNSLLGIVALELSVTGVAPSVIARKHPS